MGMFDTFRFTCPNCGEETDPQTKLGECCLDHWKLGDKTTIPSGEYIVKEKCAECGNRATVVIVRGFFTHVYKDPTPHAMQEMHYGALKPVGTDPDEALKQIAEELKKVFADEKK